MTTIVGAAAAGLVVAALGAGVAMAFDAATFLVSALVLIRIAIPAADRLPARNFLGELREGWSEFRSRTWLWAIVVQFMFVNALGNGTYVVLGPVVADRELGGASAWGAILAASAAGAVVGGLVVLRARPQRLLFVASLAIFLMAPVYLLLAVPAPVLVIAAGGFALGFGAEIFGVLWDTALQQQIPHDRLSRVSSYDALGSFVFIPIGISIAGPLSELIGVGGALVVAAGSVVVCTALVLLLRDVRDLRRTDVDATTGPDPEPQLTAEPT